MNRTCCALCSLVLLAGAADSWCAAQEQSNPQSANSDVSQAAAQKTPVMDGAAGPCSLELTVTAADGKPVYGATVKVHIAYGFGGFRRLDLDAGTNVGGKVKFVGLPARVRRPPLEFRGSKDQLAGTVTYDPEKECQANHDLVLGSPEQPAGK